MPRNGTVRKRPSRSRSQLLPPSEKGARERNLLQVTEGEHISVLRSDASSEWCYCRDEHGNLGYVLASLLEMGPPIDSPEGSLSHSDDVVSVASPVSEGSTSDLGESIGDQTSKIFYKLRHNYQDPTELSLLIDEGELVKELPAKLEDPEGRIFVESCRTGCRGFVPQSYLAAANELDTKPWFVGMMSRYEAENILELEPDGTFLVRESENAPEDFVISMKTLNEDDCLRIRHRKIKRRGTRYTAWSSYSFHTIEELVRTHNLPSGGNYLEIPFDKNSKSFNISSRRSPLVNQPRLPSRLSYPQPQSENLPPPRPVKNIPLMVEQEEHFSVQSANEYNPTQAYVYSPGIAMYGQDSMAPMQPPLPSRQPPMDQPWPIPFSGRPWTTLGSEASDSPRSSAPENTSSASGLGHDQWYVSRDQVQKLDKLGAGHYGEVFKAKHHNLDGRMMAMKTLNPKTMRVEDFRNEVRAMKELRHPYLVKLFGLCSDEGDSFMLMEFYANGSIIDYFKDHSLSQKQKQNIARQVAIGMCYLSEQNYIHRDLAARNVLLADDLSPRVADFGLAKHTKGNEEEQCDLKMPWKWTAPEALCGRKDWSVKCDVWSYGILCWEMYTNCREKVYKDITRSSDLVAKLHNGFRMDQPLDCPKPVYQILLRCWDLVPNTRISFKEIESSLTDKKSK